MLYNLCSRELFDMGLFSIFGGNKGNQLIQDMKDCLSRFMVRYATENPNDMENVAGIFANAHMMINTMTPKDAKQALGQNGVNAECGVLNIIQNYAMSEIESTPMSSWLYGGESDNGAFDLYMFVNDLKLNLGYISEEQYHDNKRLGTCLRRGQRPLI